MEMLNGSTYRQIGNRKLQVESLSLVFDRIANAQPTTIAPKEREDLIRSILSDLEEPENTVWRSWPEDVRLKALQAVKVLGRNPIGSECLARPPCLSTLLYHASLTPTPARPEASFKGLPVLTPLQSEAITILANALTLHAVGRKAVIKLGGGEGVLRLLKAVGEETGLGREEAEGKRAEGAQMAVFLLGRVLFYLTVEKGEFATSIAKDEETVDTLVKLLENLTPSQTSFRALTEVLKIVYNVVLHHPCKAKNGEDSDIKGDDWDEKLDVLLAPLLNHLYLLPQSDLLAPLTNVINALTLFPYTANLTPIWTALSPLSIQRSSSPSKRRSIYSVLTTNPFLSASNNSSFSHQKEVRPKPRTGSNSSNSSSGGKGKLSSGSRVPTPDVIIRLLAVLGNFLDANTPPLPETPDDPLPEKAKGIVMDDVLPPVVGLLTRMAMGNEVLRKALRKELLPGDLDRSPNSPPLEARPGLLGHLLRFLRCATHPQTQQTVDFFFWAVCDSDAGVVQDEIGYGNAAGLLFRRGISANPPPKPEAHIEPVSSDEETPSTSTTKTPIHTLRAASSPSPNKLRRAPKPLPASRDPITSLNPPTQALPSAFDGMSDDEKEREAERLFVAFERLNKNGVMGIENPVEVARREGRLEEMGKGEEEEARRREEREVEEGEKEMGAYKKRLGKK